MLSQGDQEKAAVQFAVDVTDRVNYIRTHGVTRPGVTNTRANQVCSGIMEDLDVYNDRLQLIVEARLENAEWFASFKDGVHYRRNKAIEKLEKLMEMVDLPEGHAPLPRECKFGVNQPIGFNENEPCVPAGPVRSRGRRAPDGADPSGVVLAVGRGRRGGFAESSVDGPGESAWRDRLPRVRRPTGGSPLWKEEDMEVAVPKRFISDSDTD